MPSSIRPSANSAASLSSSGRSSASAQGGRARKEEEAARGLAEFGSYVAMWMESCPGLVPAPPRELETRASMPPPVRPTEDRARRTQFEPSSRLSEASDARRQIAGNRREGVAHARTGLTDSRTGSVLADSRRGSTDARTLVRGHASERPELHASMRSSVLQPTRTERVDAPSGNSDSHSASDASRDSRAGAMDDSRPAQERATPGWAASANDADEGPDRLANGDNVAEAAEKNPRGQEPGSRENPEPPAASTGLTRDSAAMGAPGSTPGHSLPAEIFPGQATTERGQNLSSQDGGARPRATDPHMDFLSGTGASGAMARSGMEATAGMAGRAGHGGSSEPVPAGSDAATVASGGGTFVENAGRSDSGPSSTVPTIRVTVDQVVASVETSAGKLDPAVENAGLATGGTKEGAIDGATDSTMDSAVEMAGSRWATARGGDSSPSLSTARPFAMGFHAESSSEPVPGGATASHAVPGSREAARTVEQAALSQLGRASSSEASLGAGENDANARIPARAGADTTLPIPGSAAPAVPRVRPGSSSVEGVRSGKEASRRMTISDAASPDGAAAVNPEEGALDASGETTPWPTKPFRAGAAEMAASPEFHPASPAASSSGHTSSSGHSGATGSTHGSSRTGTPSGQPQSGGALPKVAEALLAELPPQPGSTSGKELPAARSLRVDLPGAGGGEDIRLRFLQRGNRAAGGAGAEIEVRIESQSERFVREMRAEIPSLLHRLERSGFDAGSANPGQRMTDHGEPRDASSHRYGGGSSGQSGGDGFAGGRSPDQGGGEQDQQAFPARVFARRADAPSFAGSLSSAFAGRAEAYRDDAPGTVRGEGPRESLRPGNERRK